MLSEKPQPKRKKMNKQNLSTQDRWLIKKWAKARQFEDAMASARQHYQYLFSKVHQRVMKKYPGLREYTPNRLTGKAEEADYDYGGGCVGFSLPKWLRAWNRWPSGIWLSNLSLDELVAEQAPVPNASIWLSVATEHDKRIETLRRRLRAKTSELGGQRSLRLQEHDEADNRFCLWYDLPEERSGLLKMVLQDDGQPFVNCIASHVEVMARFLQGLDHLLC
jgi:hypothetical protein